MGVFLALAVLPSPSQFFSPANPTPIMSGERTFIAIKPDGVQRGLVGDIIKRFEQKGFKLVGCKMMQGSEEHFKQHYADLSHLPFFGGLVKYMASSPVVAMAWEGTNVVKTARNIIHGSDSVDSAKKEIDLWFKADELCSYKHAAHDWVYEKWFASYSNVDVRFNSSDSSK